MTTHKPEHPTEKAILEFIVEFSKWKRDYIGNASINNVYLLVFEGKIFRIDGLLVNEVKEYDAIGAGMPYALSALFLGHTPRDATYVSCSLSCYVAEPILEEVILK